MGDSRERSVGQEINIWVQTIGIVVAALWAAWTFYFKDIFIPKTAPINIGLNLQLNKIKKKSDKLIKENQIMIPVELKLTAINPSQRKTYILPSDWVAYGYRKSDKSADDNNTFLKKGIKFIQSQEAQFTQKYIYYKSPSVVALGSLFADDSLMPGQTVTRTVIFHVPQGEYTLLEVQSSVLSVAKEKVVYVEWSLDQVNKPTYKIYRLGTNGKRNEELPLDKTGAYIDIKDELQQYNCSAMLSL